MAALGKPLATTDSLPDNARVDSPVAATRRDLPRWATPIRSMVQRLLRPFALAARTDTYLSEFEAYLGNRNG